MANTKMSIINDDPDFVEATKVVLAVQGQA